MTNNKYNKTERAVLHLEWVPIWQVIAQPVRIPHQYQRYLYKHSSFVAVGAIRHINVSRDNKLQKPQKGVNNQPMQLVHQQIGKHWMSNEPGCKKNELINLNSLILNN